MNPKARPTILGLEVDPQTRCAHYHSPLDVVAIEMRCCRTFYACKDCHEALAGHRIEVWPRREWGRRAILCGDCGATMSIRRYLGCEDRCPACRAAFNPGCRGHRHFYFETP